MYSGTPLSLPLPRRSRATPYERRRVAHPNWYSFSTSRGPYLDITCRDRRNIMPTMLPEDLSAMDPLSARKLNTLFTRYIDPSPWAEQAHIEQHDEEMSIVDSEMEYGVPISQKQEENLWY